MSATATPVDPAPIALIDIHQVGDLCQASPRTVRRLADRGAMPPPVKLGSLVRWRKAEIDAWIAGGCKPVRTPSSK